MGHNAGENFATRDVAERSPSRALGVGFAATTDGARGQSDVSLAMRAAEAGITMIPAGSVAEAMQRAAREAMAGDRIVVFGSFHAVGPALSCV